jgi:hypothetical protein
MVNGEVGNYKIAYIKENDTVLYSKMFDTIDQAMNFGHSLKTRWLIMKRIGQDGEDYAWKILPYGASSAYRIGLKIDHVRYVLIAIFIFIAIYWMSKLFKGAAPKPVIY